MDESQAPSQPFLQSGATPPQQPNQNALSALTQPGMAKSISRQQLMAGLHHLNAFKKEFAPLLNSPVLGKGNIRPKIFDASAALIGARIFSVPEVMNGLKDLPDDPLDQKKWLITKLANVDAAEKKLVADYIAQGPGEESGPDWSMDSHKEHMAGLMGSYKR